MFKFNRTEVRTGIVHFGIGRFHRAHEAVYVQELLEQGHQQWGICGVCILPYDKYIYESLCSQNGVYSLIERGNGSEAIKSIGSIVEVVYGLEHPQAVFDKLADESVKLVTFTVTEAGYFFEASTKRLDFSQESIAHDIINSRDAPRTLYGYLARGLEIRREKGIQPFTIQSCDNIQGNGDMVRSLLLEFCQRAYPDLVAWIESSVAFPNSMVDRITPAASTDELNYANDVLKLSDKIPVTSEAYRQWVVEDNYCNDRPDWAAVGVQLTDSVKPYEKIKVRLLNAGHSALGYAGHLAGFAHIHEVASDPAFQAFLRQFFTEVSTTLHPAVAGMDIEAYQDTLVDRFSNSAIKDQVLRICKDGSAKIPGFVLPTLREVLQQGDKPFRCIAFVLASFMRFVEAYSPSATPSPANTGAGLDDPEAEKLLQLVAKAGGNVAVFLRERSLFGDLGDNAALIQDMQRSYDAIGSNGIVPAMKALLTE